MLIIKKIFSLKIKGILTFAKIKNLKFFNLNYLDTLYFLNYFLFNVKLLKEINLMNSLRFKWFKFNLFMGLGYKKKVSKLKNLLYLYIADRHWLILPITNFFIFPVRRRNLIIFSPSKTNIYYINNLLKELKRKTSFKVKGFFDVRTKRRWIVIRRIKIKGLLTKLSKKQKLI